MKKILVVNQYNSDNIGDNLLNEMLRLNLEKMGFQMENAGYAQQSKQAVIYNIHSSKMNLARNLLKKKISPWLKYRLIYKSRLNDCVCKINSDEYDAIIIGGGQLLKHNSVFMYCFSYWVNWAKVHNIPIILHGIGVDVGLTQHEIDFYKNYLKYVQVINCRDTETKDIIKKQFGIDAHISPDIAFTLKKTSITGIKKNKIIVMPYNYKTANRSFYFKLRKDLYYREIKKKIDTVKVNNPKLEVVLTATTSDDAEECYRFAKWYFRNGGQCKIEKIQNSDSLFKEASKAEYMISGRMHAMIVGLIAGCKIDIIPISNKVKTFKLNYLDKVVDLDELSRQAFDGLKKSVIEIGI